MFYISNNICIDSTMSVISKHNEDYLLEHIERLALHREKDLVYSFKLNIVFLESNFMMTKSDTK